MSESFPTDEKPAICLECTGSGASDGFLCEPCHGTGLRYPVGGDLVYAGNRHPIGNLDWDDDDLNKLTPSIAPEYQHLMPPTRQERT